nr:retrovirus-related Pol polyprotein from transposon TNT 1-94 [Tanacetum cinerariifolium]
STNSISSNYDSRPTALSVPKNSLALQGLNVLQLQPCVRLVRMYFDWFPGFIPELRVFLLGEAAKFIRDFKSLAKEADESIDKITVLETEYERLLRAVASQDIMAIVQSPSVVKAFDLQTKLERDLKGKSMDTQCASDTLDPSSQKLDDENVSLEFQVVEMIDLSNPVTSNSVPTTKESKLVKNDKVIAPAIFRINHSKTSKKDKFMPINKVRASVKTKTITISQPHIITKKDVNSDSNGLSSTGVNNTAKTRSFKGDNACASNPQVPINKRNLKLLLNFVWKFIRTVHFGNDHIAAILVRDTCFVRNLEGVDLLKGNRTKNLFTINLNEMASTSPIFLMDRATSTKSWLWHQRLSHHNFDTINELAKNDLVIGLPKFKYHKKHLCPSCEQEKSKKAPHNLKRVPNLKLRLHLLYMDLGRPMRVEIINEKRYRQEEGIYFEGSFAPVARMEAIRIFLAYAAQKSFIVLQIDMKTAFLHGSLKEDMYVCQLEDFIDANHPRHVYKLNKALYGLNQAPMAWYDELLKFLLQNHFSIGTIYPTMFIRHFDDDILVVQAQLTEKHLKVVKRIFHYLWGTINMALWYTKDSGFELTVFLDVDHVGCQDSYKSTSDGTQFLGEKLASCFMDSMVIPNSDVSMAGLTRTEPDKPYQGAEWPLIIEEEEMPNVVPCKDSFVEEIVRGSNVTIKELHENEEGAIVLYDPLDNVLQSPFNVSVDLGVLSEFKIKFITLLFHLLCILSLIALSGS